jgi:hypothetical protein
MGIILTNRIGLYWELYQKPGLNPMTGEKVMLRSKLS